MPRPVILRIETVADIAQLDRLITSVDLLQQQVKELARFANAANPEMKELATNVSALGRSAKTAATNTTALATNMQNLHTQVAAVNGVMGTTDNLMNGAAVAAANMAVAVKAAAAGQKEWNAANKGQKKSFMGTIAQDANEVKTAVNSAATAMVPFYHALNAGPPKSMRELAIVMQDINIVGRTANAFMTQFNGSYVKLAPNVTKLNNALAAGAPPLLMLASGLEKARMGAIPLGMSFTRINQAAIPLGGTLLMLGSGLTVAAAKVNPFVAGLNLLGNAFRTAGTGTVGIFNTALMNTKIALSMVAPHLNTIANLARQNIWNSLGKSTQSFHTTLTRLLSPIQTLINVLTKLMQVVGASLKAAFNGASATIKAFASSAASTFAMLQRSVQGIQGAFRGFQNTVKTHMQAAQRHIRDFYNAGWSLLTSGRAFQNVGQQMWRGLAGMFQGYMEFEKSAVRTAISASTSIRTIQDMVFGLQKGSDTNPAIMQFNAEELSQGLYYFTSAIGTDLSKATDKQLDDVAQTVGQIMQLAAATQTGLETTTKGVLNAAMEFGINPRDLNESADALKNLAAQFGYLANKTTMEVPDIAQAFKMVGPLAHVMSGDEAGAGLNETFALIGLASDVGLRGGNVGRGINQMLQTILDPSNPAIESAAEAFGFEASSTAFRAFFLNADDTLKGGLPGLFEKLEQLSPSAAAGIFTTNASRAIIGMVQAAKTFDDPDFGQGMEGFLKMMNDPDASMEFLSNATARNAETIVANVQNIKNAFFAMSSEIIDAVKPTLLPMLQTFAKGLWAIADFLRTNETARGLAKTVVVIAAIVASFVTLAGTVMMASGSILLVMKAFTLLGSVSHPVLIFLYTMTTGLVTLLPILGLVAGAALFFKRAWQENLYDVQGRVDGLREHFEDLLKDLTGGGKDKGIAFFRLYEKASYDAGLAIIAFAVAHKEYLYDALDVVRAFVDGFVTGFKETITVIASLGMTIYNFIAANIIPFRNAIVELMTEITGVNTTAGEFATTLGQILGGAFALFLAQHLIPTVLTIGLFKAAIVLLNVTLFTLSTTLGVVSGAFRVVAFTIGVTQTAVEGLIALVGVLTFGSTALASVLGAILVGGLVLLGIAFANALLTVEGFKENVITVLGSIWEGIAPAFEVIGVIVLASIQAVTGILVEFFATLSQHQEGLRTFGLLIGVVLVAAFALFAGGAVLAALLVTQAIQGIVTALDDLPGLTKWLDGIYADLGTFFDSLSLGTFDMDNFKEMMILQFRSAFQQINIALLEESARFLQDLSNMAEKYSGLGWVFDRIGVEFDPDLAKVLYGDGTIVNPGQGTVLWKESEKLFDIAEAQDTLRREQENLNENARGLQEAVSEYPMAEDFGDSGSLLGQLSSIKSFDDFKGVWKDIQDQFNLSIPTGLFNPDEVYQQLTQETATSRFKGDFGAAFAKSMPGIFDSAESEYNEALDDFILSTTKAFNDAMLNPSFDLTTALAAVYGTGPGEQSMANIIQQFGGTLLENIKEFAPEMSLTDLLIDAAVHGNLGGDVAGANLHNALMPTVQRLAQATGMSIDDILKNVPKYSAPEKYLPMATAELLSTLDSMPESVAAGIQTLGASIGKQIDFDELLNWIGSRKPGVDWNLAHFIMDSYGYTLEEAQALIRSSGLNENMLSSLNFDDTMGLINAQGGAITVLSDSWYEMLHQLDADGDKVIKLSQSAFNEIPDYVKAIYSQMGYGIVIGAGEATENISIANQMILDRLKETYKVFEPGANGAMNEDTGDSVNSFWKKLYADLADDGIVNSLLTELDSRVDEFGNVYRRFKDEGTGQILEINGVELDEGAIAAMAEAEAYMNRMESLRQRLQKNKEELRLLQEQRAFAKGIVPDFLNPFMDDVEVEKGQIDRIRAALGLTTDDAGEVTMDIKVNFSDEAGKTAATEIVTKINTGISEALSTEGSVDLTGFEALGGEAANAFLAGFRTAMTNFNPASPAADAKSKDFRGSGGVKTESTPSVSTTTLAVNSATFYEDIRAANTTLGIFRDATWKTTLLASSTTLTTQLGTAHNAALAFQNMTYTTTLNADNVSFLLKWQSAWDAGAAFANHTFQTTLSANNAPFFTAWQAAWNAGNTFANQTFSATLSTTGGAPQKQATGGITTSGLQLVGEEGPELAAMPLGTRVQSTGRSMRMLTDAVSSATTPRDTTPITATPEFRQAAHWLSESQAQGGGDVHVEINGLVIEKEVDIDAAFGRINTLIGRQNAMAQRGMIPVNSLRTL